MSTTMKEGSEMRLLFSSDDLDDHDDERFRGDLSVELRRIVRSAEFLAGDRSELNSLYSQVNERLTMIACGFFDGYAAGFREAAREALKALKA